MKANNKLKKIAGDKLAKYIALNFNEDAAINAITELFNNDGRDVKNVNQSEYVTLKKILNKKINGEKEEIEIVEVETATELLKKQGYTLTLCKTKEDLLSFKKYFRSGEELCKFNDTNRHKSYNVFFIVKDDAENIEPLSSPKRQDEYSTSVCSIQVSKDGKNVTQITSRYNHKVSGCDNTFSSNLNNICDGLIDGFNEEFGYSIGASTEHELSDFVYFDKKYVHYFNEINGTKIGKNTIVSDRIINYPSDTHITWDNFIINTKDCIIEWSKDLFGYQDGFVTYFNETVKKVQIVKDIDLVDDNGSDEVCYIQKDSIK